MAERLGNALSEGGLAILLTSFTNLIAFNVGVEIGQLLALSAILIVMGYWRRTASFWRHAYTANVAMMSAGFLLMGYQLTGLIVSQ